jgi:hypothetical protein
MIKKKLTGYLSWIGMWDANFLFESGGKLATLWFDELVLQVPDKTFVSFVLHEVPGQPSDQGTLKELEKAWVPVQKYVPNYVFGAKPWGSDKSPVIDIIKDVTGKEAWGPNDAALADIVRNVTRKEIKRESPELSETDAAFRIDFAREGAGLLESVALYMFLNAKGACCFLPRWREPLVLQELFGSAAERKPVALFSEILRYRAPDLESQPWEKIVELRYHPFLGSFRDKVNELHAKISAGDKGSISELVDEIFLADMEKMIRLFRPSTSRTIVKGIASNVPLPIPINPASVVFALQDVMKERDIKGKYGWLYFLLDLEAPRSSSQRRRRGPAGRS